MAIKYAITLPKPGDTFNVLLQKLLQRLGGATLSGGNSDELVLREILARMSGLNISGDSTPAETLAKILTLVN